MEDNGPRSFTIACPTALPGISATVVIFDSTAAFGPKQLRHVPLARISFAVMNSHTGTLKASRSSNGGTNWDVFDSRAVTVPASNTISGPYDYLIDTYEDFKLEFVNDGTAQTTWRPELKGHENRQPGT